ncbi:MAG TPA: FAD-binding oxidoreductase [Myxococcota bacterium]|nr:FAD-binding oxidoreductase [Myxococcota bacterium]HQK52487.1 FAD-binding oxidoreductase [Myxococcota bacterium]
MTRKDWKWNGWGTEGVRYDLGSHREAFLQWLGSRLEMDAPGTRWPSVALGDILLPETRIDGGGLQDLGAALTTGGSVTTDPEDRIRHAMGRSLVDLFRYRLGRLPGSPDAVVHVTSREEVAAVGRVCAARGLALVPFGGGSSVVGGVEAVDPRNRPIVTMNLRGWSGIQDLREEDGYAVVAAGTLGPDLETALNARGWSLGHFPQSFEFSTVGGWVASRSSGQQSNQYGDIADMVAGCRLWTPAGDWQTWEGPVSGAGPDLREVVAGSEGTLGVLTDVTLQVHRLPKTFRIQAVLFPSFVEGTGALKAIVEAGLRLSFLRLSDGEETAFYLKIGHPNRWKDLGMAVLGRLGFGPDRSVMLLGTEGDPEEVDRATAEALRIAKRHGGLSLGQGPASGWHRDRFRHPYLRDDLLDHGIAIETHETAVPWSRVDPVRQSVRQAVAETLARQGRRAIVMAHLSHSYPAGTCIYFIVIYPVDREDPVAQWRPLKAAIADAAARHGGTISHHHGVGLDHRPWWVQETGPVGLRLIQGMKAALDPDHLCNPGKLMPLPEG